MLLLITSKIDEKKLKQVSEDLNGYIKFVIDIKRGFLAAGGKRHVEAEQLLLQNGSKQNDLWGGGLDLETDDLDFDSMINIRPSAGNNSREVLAKDLRKSLEKIVRELLR